MRKPAGFCNFTFELFFLYNYRHRKMATIDNSYLGSAQQVYDWLADKLSSSHELLPFTLTILNGGRAVSVKRELGGAATFRVATKNWAEDGETGVDYWETLPPLDLLEGRVDGPAEFIAARTDGILRRWLSPIY